MSNPETRWTIYGRVVSKTERHRTVRGFHVDRMASLEAAKAALAAGRQEHGDQLVAVLVELAFGEDIHGERKVIHRTTSEARAWWE